MLSVRADESNEALRKQLHKLEYELNNLHAERKLQALRHDEEVKTQQRKVESDYERAKAAESASNIANSRYETLVKELEEAKEVAAESHSDLERQLRESQERSALLQEQVDEKDVEAQEREREVQRDMADLKARYEPLHKELEDVKAQSTEKDKIIDTVQQRLKDSEDDVALLQTQVTRLKVQTGDADTLNVVKRELSEQIDHIRKLEAQSHRQQMELKKLHEERKEVELVEEQKRTLEGKLSRMEDLRKALGEAQLQKHILEDERKAWTSLLESESTGDMDVTFERPEDLARAFLSERLEKLSLIDQLGTISPELAAKDEQIQLLESRLRSMRSELDKIRVSGSPANMSASGATGPDAKLKARLERQRALALKEVDYLRAQMRNFDEEQAEMTSEKFDEARSERIKELESLLDQHRTELSTLQSDLEQAEAVASQPSAPQPTAGSKRPREDANDDTERASSMARKARSLQDELNKVSTARTLLEKELHAARSQLESLKASSQTRILEFRANPTAEAARIKQTTLDTLRSENESLLQQLESLHSDENTAPATRNGDRKSRNKMVPATTADRLRAELDEKTKAIATLEKKEKRLKTTFSAQVRQFREACASVLGWDLHILPNDRAKVTSMFDPSKTDKRTSEDESEEEEPEERSIVFDARAGTMKVSGGPRSKFADEIRGNIEYWVDGRKEVPCFLAACTLEFWERGPGANTISEGR